MVALPSNKIKIMPKEELKRLKAAFFTKKDNSQTLQKSNPRITTGLLIAASSSIILIALLVSLISKDAAVSKEVKLTKKSTPKENIPAPTLRRSLALKEVFPEEIESIFLIQEMHRLKPLLKKLPITINGSSVTLVVNLKNPLNIYQNSLKVHFDDELDSLDVILKDYLYFSNSLNPISVNLDNTKVLEIDAKALGFARSDLNLYKVSQLRIIFDLKKLPVDFKIKSIEIAKR